MNYSWSYTYLNRTRILQKLSNTPKHKNRCLTYTYAHFILQLRFSPFYGRSFPFFASPLKQDQWQALAVGSLFLCLSLFYIKTNIEITNTVSARTRSFYMDCLHLFSTQLDDRQLYIFIRVYASGLTSCRIISFTMKNG